eukprot:CCRYP_014984-RB/>CCRYP_014984-RB protein AED:0.07 eAED:0.07 QI:374/1/1/1/0.75/0.8/5/452/1103
MPMISLYPSIFHLPRSVFFHDAVKLYDQGLTSIQVTDNGTGVPSSCRGLMAAKHATSKLRSFSDLYGNTSDANQYEGNANTSAGDAEPNIQSASTVSTLGFRGEALFSLANISKSMVVSTRTCDENAGEEFSFDPQGNLIAETRRTVARGVGTTVTVNGLFERLPVRRVDLCKRIKTQRMKLIKVLQGYAILCLGTQFTLIDVNTTAKSKSKSTTKQAEVVRLATSDSSTTATLKTRIASILGTKFLDGLSCIEIDLSSAVKGEKPSSWKVQGLVSHSPASPYPSTAREHHFFSINGRPVDLPAASRVIGDVWRRFDPSETCRRPACILAFTLPNQAFDVNLSPDKRQVLFTEESAILELIRNGLVELWTEQSEGKFAANEVEIRTNGSAKGGTCDAAEIDNNGKYIKATTDPTAICNEEVNIGTPRTRRAKSDGPLNESPSVNKSSSSIMDKRVITPTLTQTQPEASDTSSKDSITTASPEESHIEEGNSTKEDESNKYEVKPQKEKQRDRRVWEQMKLTFNRFNKSEQRQEMAQMLSMDPSMASEGQDARKNADCRPDAMADTRGMPSQSTSPVELSTAQIEPTFTNGKGTSEAESMIDDFAFGSSNSKNEVEKCGKDSTATEPSIEDNRVSSRRQKSMHEESDEVLNSPKRKARDDSTAFLDDFSFGLTKSNRKDAKVDSNREEFHSTDPPEPKHLRSASYCQSSKADESVRGNGRMISGKRIISQKLSRTFQGRARETEPLDPTPSTVRDRSRRQSSRDVFDSNDCNQREHPPIQVPYETMWSSFAGTQSVMAQAQHSLVLMRKKRKLFHSSLKREKDTLDLQNSFSDATDTTQVNLSREDFAHMSIIGQFNLGFILVRCRNHNLWILDQHACDEKYNFERLCKETILHQQNLMTPLPLELSPSEEHCILEHMDVFKTNGFRFDYNPAKDPRHRLSLTALPHSGSGGDGTKAVQFGKEDVWALCAMLGAEGTTSSGGHIAGYGTGADGSGSGSSNAVKRLAGITSGSSNANSVVGPYVVRLPKAIAMFASRACRKSIMIGTALSSKEQLEILKKLEKTDVPWNCAHGRPTISHIRNLAQSLLNDDSITYQSSGPCLSVL